MSTKHKQTKVVHPDEGEIEVDAGIAELLEQLWFLDIDTSMSCQGDPGSTVWIEFPSSKDLVRFLETVADHLNYDDPADLELRKRMTVQYRLSGDWPMGWEYRVIPFEHAEFEDYAPESLLPAAFYVPIGLHFPYSDFKKVSFAIGFAASLEMHRLDELEKPANA